MASEIRRSLPATDASAPSVGTAPVNWNNDDLLDWRTPVPFPAILDEMAAAGYAGTEYGGNFAQEPEVLRRELAARHLRLAGSYQWLHLRDHATLETEMGRLSGTLDLLTAAGSTNLIVADAMSPERIAIAGQVPEDGSAGLDDEGWSRLAGGLRLVAELAEALGVRIHYHNHVGTHVETPAEVERFLAEIEGSDVDLCFDTGHFAYGGGNPTEFVLRHRDRIGYLHLKDVDAEMLAVARVEKLSFLDALRRCVFCEFGDGMVDIPRVVDTLRGGGYRGWIIVEQDTSRKPSTESAAASRRYLRERCGI